VRNGDEITIHYDPMIAKLIVYSENRQDAIRRMDRALTQYVILGLTTNLHFLRDVINHPDFHQGRTTTALLERHFANWQPPDEAIPDEALIAAALSEMHTAQNHTRSVGELAPEGDIYSPWVRSDGFRMGETA
jgi:3-methylcrotonyl-CoA carboxylase alpha subunit